MNLPIPLRWFLRWTLRSCVVGLLTGTASAFFLWLLKLVIGAREEHAWLIYGLPVFAAFAAWAYARYGQGADQGTDLLFDEIHEPRQIVPFQMAPLVLGATLLTQLGGGSAGREGTAVQMGGTLADQLSLYFGLPAEDRRLLLMAGIAGGFGSVFGTPIAGAIFAIEVLALGRLRYDALWPCLLTAAVANWMTLSWGIHHDGLPSLDAFAALSGMGGSFHPSFSAMAWSLLIGAGCGGVARLFIGLTRQVHRFSSRWIRSAILRAGVGGALIVAFFVLTGSTRYLGLGVPTILASFQMPLPPWDFALKLLLTAVTLGFGLKGGEVTPLFFVGAAFGNALGAFVPFPRPILSGLGLVGVFAGASNTPIACAWLAVELFGGKIGLLAALTCTASYFASGHRSIYSSQRVGHPKLGAWAGDEGKRIGEVPRGFL